MGGELAPWRIKTARCIIAVLAIGVGGLLAWAGWFHQLDDQRKIASWAKVPCTILRWDMQVSETAYGANASRHTFYRYEFGGKTYTGQNYDKGSDKEPDLRDFEEEGVAARKGPTYCHVNPANPWESSFHGPRPGFPWALTIGGLLLALAGFVFLILTFVPRKRLPPELAAARYNRRVLLLLGLGLMTGACLMGSQRNLIPAIEGQLLRQKLIQVPAEIETTGYYETRGSGRNRNLTFRKVTVLYSYTYGGRTWHADRWYYHSTVRDGGSDEETDALRSPYPRGLAVTAWIDPRRPWIATLDPGLSWYDLWFIAPLALGGFGLRMLWQFWSTRPRA